MSTIKIRIGKRKVAIHKSTQLVGLKRKGAISKLNARAIPKSFSDSSFVKTNIYDTLGGFNIVKLRTDGTSLDWKLDEVRSYDSVELGTHVYYTDESERMLVPTGELYITFYEGVSEEEQEIVLDEYKLAFVRRRSGECIVAKVTAQSKNPLKVAAELEGYSLVRVVEPDLDAILDDYDYDYV